MARSKLSMSNVSYKYISNILFSDLFNWSVQYAKKSKLMFNKQYDSVKIGAFLTRIKKPINIDDNQNYKRVSIKLYNGGIVLRDIERGSNVGTKKQFIINAGQFLLSKIDARNGAIGIVPASCDNAVITGNFWSFEINTELIVPKFLTLLTTTKYFTKLFDDASNGTTNRHYLQEDLFLNMEVPLPPIERQYEIVDDYNAKIQVAEKNEREALNLEKEIEETLFEKLGISSVLQQKASISNSLLSFVNYSFISRWGVEFLKNEKVNKKLLKSASLPMRKLGNLVEIDPKNNFSDLDKNLEMSFIPMECVSDEYGEIISLKVGCNEKSKGYTRFQDGDLIWAKITPCMQNGKSAILKDLKNGYGYGSTEFYVIRNTNSEIHLDYIYHILRTDTVLKNAMTFFTGSSGQQRVPKSFLENLEIPLPDFATQVQISNDIYAIKKRIKELHTNAEKCRGEAIRGFEKELLG